MEDHNSSTSKKLETLENLRRILLVPHGMVDPKRSMAYEAKFWGDAPERVMLLLHASNLLTGPHSIIDMCQDLVEIQELHDAVLDPPLGVLTYQRQPVSRDRYPSYGFDLVRASNILLMALAACIESFPEELCGDNLELGLELAYRCQVYFDENSYLAHSTVYSYEITREALARAGKSLEWWIKKKKGENEEQQPN